MAVGRPRVLMPMTEVEDSEQSMGEAHDAHTLFAANNAVGCQPEAGVKWAKLKPGRYQSAEGRWGA